MEPTSSTASATAVHSNPSENLPEPASEVEKPPVAFGLNVRKEAADGSTFVREPDMPSSGVIKDKPFSSSLGSFPESDDNPFDAAYKAAQAEASKEPENYRSVVDRLESLYGPIRKSPEQKKLEQTLFTSTTRM